MYIFVFRVGKAEMGKWLLTNDNFDINEIIRFEDRRSMPITKPRIVASIMPTIASKSVLKMPTINTSLWVLVSKSKPVRFMPSVVGMKPAISPIKSKPGFMLRRSRFVDVLSNKK